MHKLELIEKDNIRTLSIGSKWISYDFGLDFNCMNHIRI
jgi:hypothetical protein